MEKTTAGLRLFYDPAESETAALVEAACERSVDLIRRLWRLPLSEDCRVYVMTSWPQFLFQSATWPWKIYLLLTFPLTAIRAGSVWPYAGGWTLRYGRRCAVGVKPPRLLQSADHSVGKRFFMERQSLQEKVETITCHELVHAFTAHLRLPAWLNEGLATRAMEHYLGENLVRAATLDYLVPPPTPPGSRAGKDRHLAVITLFSRGYWLTRAIEETRPDLLDDLLSRRLPPKTLETMVAEAFDVNPARFWQEIGPKVKEVVQRAALAE